MNYLGDTQGRSDPETPTSRQLFERARRRIPGGVNSPVRAMGSVGRDHPVFLQRGAGAHVWDADGTRYVDWMLSWGALPLGHCDAQVVAAVLEAAGRGSSFGAPTELEVELAELICDAIPSLEQVRFVSSGTEALMSAVRLARAATGRDAIVTFAGCYHGHADPFLATGGSGMATLAIPSSPGVPATTTADTLIARYNDLQSVEQAIEDSGKRVAAIVVEPVAANMGVVAPSEGFLEGLRALCDRIGALLIFDEVITGFRLAWGGAQERFGVRPDLATYGKVIGGGLPVGAFGGSRDLMELVAPAGTVYQAGTLSGNPLAMAAGLAQLRAMRERDAFATLDRIGDSLRAALEKVVQDSGAQVAVSQVGSLVTLFHLPADAGGVPSNFDDARALDTERFSRTHAAALSAGHLLPPSQFEALFASTMHSEEDIASLAASVGETLGSAVAAHA